MSITQTVEIPANHRLTIDVPPEVPAGPVTLVYFPAVDQRPTDQRSATPAAHPCPICAAHIDPETGNPRYNADTIAAIEEGRAMLRGELPTKWYDNFEDMWEDLNNENLDDYDDLDD